MGNFVTILKEKQYWDIGKKCLKTSYFDFYENFENTALICFMNNWFNEWTFIDSVNWE